MNQEEAFLIRAFRERFTKLNESPSVEGLMVHGLALSLGLLQQIPVDFVGDVEAFHAKFGIAYFGPPRDLDHELKTFRVKRLKDELREYLQAVEEGNLGEQLDGLVDLVYIALGTAHLHGWNFREAWRRVQAANMAKEKSSAKNPGKFGHSSDIVKPPGWVAPTMRGLV